MIVALFGATGHTGRRVLARLMNDRHRVRVLVRTPAKLETTLPANDVITGDARDAVAVDVVLKDAEAAVSCLGMSDIAIPATDLSESYAIIGAAMGRAGLTRLIGMAAAGALDDPRGGLRSEHPGLPPMLKHVAAEHARVYRRLAAGKLDWTLFCPGFLVQASSPDYQTVAEAWPEGARETGYGHLADAIARELVHPQWIRRRVGIAAQPERRP